jgi:NAD(P)-dependent dehydrogenase (short-subunit alcohol dehydrogenase family)
MKDLEDAGITTITLDVTDEKSVLTAKEQVVSITGGALDILINNA